MPQETGGMDAVFKALADPTRRLLLDRLRERDGQTLGQLCEHLDMARQSATQHLDVLVRAHLVTVVRRGRERLHHLNPVPIHQIEQRWISRFDRPRLQALRTIKDKAEEYAMTDTSTTGAPVTGPPVTGTPVTEGTTSVPTYVYVTYVGATVEQVWRALTDAEVTARYWGHANVSDWQPGSRWEHRRGDASGQVDVAGRVLASDPPTRLVITFGESAESADGASVVTFSIEPHHDIVRLTVTHENLADPNALREVSHGWPAVLANLKSLLETGDVLPSAPWEMTPAHR